MKKKGQVMDQLGALGIGVAALAITLVIAFLIISEGQNTIVSSASPCGNSSNFWNATIEQCCQAATPAAHCGGANLTQAYSSSWNATNTLSNAVDDVPGWVPIVIITAIGALLIGMIALFKRR